MLAYIERSQLFNIIIRENTSVRQFSVSLPKHVLPRLFFFKELVLDLGKNMQVN